MILAHLHPPTTPPSRVSSAACMHCHVPAEAPWYARRTILRPALVLPSYAQRLRHLTPSARGILFAVASALPRLGTQGTCFAPRMSETRPRMSETRPAMSETRTWMSETRQAKRRALRQNTQHHRAKVRATSPDGPSLTSSCRFAPADNRTQDECININACKSSML